MTSFTSSGFEPPPTGTAVTFGLSKTGAGRYAWCSICPTLNSTMATNPPTMRAGSVRPIKAPTSTPIPSPASACATTGAPNSSAS